MLGRGWVDAVPLVRRRAGVGLWRLGVDTLDPIGHRLARYVETNRVCIRELLGAQWQRQVLKNPVDDILASDDSDRLQPRMASRTVQDVNAKGVVVILHLLQWM